MDKINFELIRRFGPSVFKVKMPENLILKLNNYIDEIISNEKKSKQLDNGNDLVGDVTQEFKLEQKIMEETGWGQFLADCAQKWI